MNIRTALLALAAYGSTFFACHAQLPAYVGTVQMPRQYVADMEVTTNNAKTRSRVYCDGQNYRAEIQTPEMEMVTITRTDRRAIYTIMPAQKSYMEIPLDARQLKDMEEKMKPKVEWKQEGQETVRGQLCDKYVMTSQFTSPASGQGVVSTTVYYLNPKTKFPVRFVTKTEQSESVTDFLSLEPKKPAASLFEIPSDYTRFEMPTAPGMGGAVK